MKKQVNFEEWKLSINDDNSVSVFKNENLCSNSKEALREIASKVDFSYDAKWTTRQLGAKLVDFLNTNAPQTFALKPETKASKKNNVRVEVEIVEHDYVAFDSNDEMMDESFMFNSDEGPNDVHIYIDGEEVDFEWDEFSERTGYSNYQTFDMEKKWNNDDIVKFGYYDNVATKVWAFEVENFDIEKMSFYYECFDAKFGPADHNWEEHRITLHYDGQEIEEDIESYDCSDGDFVQRWCMWGDDDDDDECWDDEEEEVEEKVEEDDNEKKKLSEVFAILAWTLADIDDSVEKEELGIIFGVANNFEELDAATVKLRIALESKGIRDYESHSELVRGVPEEHRIMLFNALVMVAVSDSRISQVELQFLGGICDIWEWDWDMCCEIINHNVAEFKENFPGREVEIEE